MKFLIKKTWLVITSFLILCVTGCTPSAGSVDNKIGFEIKLPGKVEKAAFYTQNDVFNYEITIKLGNDVVKTCSGKPGETIKIILDDEGTYHIEMKAYNEAGTLIADGDKTVELHYGDGIVKTKIVLNPKQKPEIGFEFEIEWAKPEDITPVLLNSIQDGDNSFFYFYDDGTYVVRETGYDSFEVFMDIIWERGTYTGNPTQDGVLVCTALERLPEDSQPVFNALYDSGVKSITYEDLPPLAAYEIPECFKLTIVDNCIEKYETIE